VFDAISYIKSEIDDLLRQRDASEQVLRKSEARYRQLVEHAQAGILEFDYQANRITSVNESFLGISGYSKEEVFSKNPLELMTEESRAVFVERLSQRQAGRILSSDSVYQFITKDGQTKWVLLNSNITYDAGQPRKADIVLIDITHLKEIENKLISYQSKLKKLSVQLSRSEESQRRLLASRLHESVSQELFAAQLKLNELQKSMDDPKVTSRLKEVNDQIVKSIKDIRGITYDLSPPVLYDLGLKEAVESLAKSISAQYHLSVKARFIGSLENMDDEIKIITYRVIREIVQNAIKHARAGFIDIIVESKNDTLSVDVSDNGVGFDADTLAEGQYSSDGFGIFDIREKINHLGGHLRIHSTPGSGTRIGLSVPLKETMLTDLKN
jgi:PAS domain S-box-containing protein